MTTPTTSATKPVAQSATQLTIRDRFHGHILGFGTASGTRLVVGTWHTSPLGAFTDVMVAHPDGRRELLAPSYEVAEYVTATYSFDDVRITPIAVSYQPDPAASSLASPQAPSFASADPGGRLRVASAVLEVTADLGVRTASGWALRAIPARFNGPALTRLSDPVARIVMPGVRTRGSAGNGRREYYCARDVLGVRSVRAVLDGSDCGELREVSPAPKFGFSSTPKVPALTRVTTVIDRPQ